MDLNQATDEELMAAYQNGQEMAFHILYERHHQKIYGFLSNRLSSPQLADEAFQTTFLKLHQSRQKYDPSFPFLPWLFTLCRNAMLDLMRSQKRIHRKEELDPAAVEAAPAVFEEQRDIPSLNSLSTTHREVIELRYLEDLPFEEIAKRLKTSPTNARQMVSRATRTLKKWMNSQTGSEL